MPKSNKMVPLVYAGRRFITGGKVYHLFFDGKEERLYSSFARRGIIGGIYQGEKKGKSTLLHKRVFLGFNESLGDKKIRVWEAEDLAVQEECRKRREQSQIAKEKRLQPIAASLADILEDYSSHWEFANVVRGITRMAYDIYSARMKATMRRRKKK